MSPDKNNPKRGALWLGRAIPAIILLVATAQAWASVTVTLSAPAEGSIYTPSSNITLTAAASAGQGFTLSKVEFFSGTSLIGTDFSAPYGLTWAGAPLGQHSLTAKATAVKKNNPDQTATSAAVDITVKALLHYVHIDHLNSPRLISNAAQQVVWRRDNQEPFNDSPPDENPSGLGVFEFPLGFPGQYFDKETNLHYNYRRDYDPGTGRYVQSDPIGLQGGLNTYAYVGARPLSRTDVLGLLTGYGGCSATDRKQIEDAEREVARVLEANCRPCDDNSSDCVPCNRIDDVRKKLISATVSCAGSDKPIFPGSPLPRCGEAFDPGNSITIFPVGLGKTKPPAGSSCNCLAGNVFHEVLHSVGGFTHPEIYQAQQSCFPCSNIPPDWTK